MKMIITIIMLTIVLKMVITIMMLTIVMKLMITIMMNGSPLKSLARALFDQSTKSLPETDEIR